MNWLSSQMQSFGNSLISIRARARFFFGPSSRGSSNGEGCICCSCSGRIGSVSACCRAPGSSCADVSCYLRVWCRYPLADRDGFATGGPISWAVSAGSLIALAVLGAAGAQTGGAGILRPMMRVTFWGAIAMGTTAGHRPPCRACPISVQENGGAARSGARVDQNLNSAELAASGAKLPLRSNLT